MSYSLLAPGPVNLHPEVRRILSLPMIHHRTPEFDAILARTLTGLKKIFVTNRPVFMHTSTGTGGMEALLVNTLSPGDKVLAVVSGKFGERWAQMAAAYGGDVTTLNVSWGKAVDPKEIRRHLEQQPDTRLVLTQACETSTGVLHPIQEIAAITRELPGTLLLVDGITAVGALPLPMDEWGIDGLVAGSQKAFMLPTGLSFTCFSAKAWPVVEKASTPRYYFDVRAELAANQKGETFFSSPVPLIRALDWVLSDVENSGGLSKLHQTIERRARMTRFFAERADLTLFAAENPSSSLTALTLPVGFDGQKIRQRLEDRYQLTIMGGQDQAKGRILRIGHMGHITDAEMLRLYDAIGECLQDVGVPGWTDDRRRLIHADMERWIQEDTL